MVRLRLQRLGRRHRPFYRLNAIDQRTRRDGKVIESLGWYNPLAKDGETQVEFKMDRIQHWLSQGAQPSDTVRDMLARMDALSPEAIAEWKAKREADKARVEAAKIKKEADDAAAAAKAKAAADAKAAEAQAKADAAAKAKADAEAAKAEAAKG